MKHPLCERIMAEMRLTVQINGELSLYDNGAEETCNPKEFDEILSELRKLPAEEAIEILKEVSAVKYGDAFVAGINEVLGQMDIEIEDPWADNVFDATEDILYNED